jgi:CheY-like chemotaxis protein
MEAQPKTNIQILVVDDEPSVRAALSLLLKYEGHEVRTADCGEAALLMLGQHEFDIVITDFFMPGIKGDELASRIKRTFPGVAVIIITAFAEEYQDFAVSSGKVDALLLKPFSREALCEVVAHVLSKRKPVGTADFPCVLLPQEMSGAGTARKPSPAAP